MFRQKVSDSSPLGAAGGARGSANPLGVRRYATILTLLALVGGLTPTPSNAQEMTPSTHAAIDTISIAAANYLADQANVEFGHIFAGGGTLLTNGVFFPGTMTCDNGTCTNYGPIPQVKKGSNITFVNLDEGAVANDHRIVCTKRLRGGRPACVSQQLNSPGETSEMIIAKLKPGVYDYMCTIHFGMYGAFEVIK